VLAGFVLFTWGLVAAFGGGLVLWLGNLGELVTDLTLTADQIELIEEFDKQATAAGGVLLILGLVMVIGAIGIWAHRKWGRAFGIILGLLGTLFAIGMIVSAITFEAGGVTVEGAFAGDEPSLGAGILVFGTFLLVLLAMYMGKRQFRKKGVE